MELVLGEFDKRFNYHFYGDKKTNLPSKPEWFFSQLSCWAENNLEYFEVYLQPFVDEVLFLFLINIKILKIFLGKIKGF